MLRRWDMALDVERAPGALSTRAELAYHNAKLESRNFRYTTPVIRPIPRDLAASPALASKAFRLMTVPKALHNEVDALLHLRETAGLGLPLIIREPRLTSCTPDHLPDVFGAVPYVDVIRCAEHGALILSHDVPATWVPAYWTISSPSSPLMSKTHAPAATRHSQVIDTTGAGNCFLGGYAIGFVTTGDPIQAAHFGSVASSFVV
ncbi:uncharacterized protein HMPREF1541_06628 [Cyphellophora europaea CBS 101466]|uniref:Carbohydrate kinase PfkB domain-containing protein n=1 Tax=Cyphellophora europaea (strain CBS 101466) TaxID=1220924 RepID=W2RPZ2_CYPE1|nr:uncharacterized protein HMPREF1541_06628 [Cyphellophora europaea CBS 101466]ETN38591.1 hypothetical protein HMPREF1541_06628 [Cyphellophora europaea CBS 101466]